MAHVDEQLSAHFHQWELRGRGWQVWPTPVSPEPAFKPFAGHIIRRSPFTDDGRRPTAASSLIHRLAQKLSGEPPPLQSDSAQNEEEPCPETLERSALVELHIALPADHKDSPEMFAGFLATLGYCREPLAFELVGLPDSIVTQFAVDPSDLSVVERQLHSHFPEAVCIRQENLLDVAWHSLRDADTAIVEFGLAREFMFPLAMDSLDILVGLTAALADLREGEAGLFQVIFEPVRHAWADSLLRAVSDGSGKPAFVNAPELLSFGERKVSQPLYAAVVRVAARSDDFDRAWSIVREMAGVLSALAHAQGNELIPLSNDDYPLNLHAEDVPLRQTRRSGMLLNRDELLQFVHLPSSAVQTPKLKRALLKTRPAPKLTQNEGRWLLGQNVHAGRGISVRLTADQRVKHMHVIGASGTGKSTLLFNLIRQDIENGEGVAVFDPHGDLVERILGVIPPARIDDVVLVDPSDEEFVVGFNILSAHSDFEKNLLASDLVSVFQRLSSSWGDQMGSVLNNAILAFLESSQGGTLADLRRFLLEPAFRSQFLKTVRDPDIIYYWRTGFTQLSGNKSIGPVLTRLETFLSPKPIRYMVSQPVNRLDFAQILDTGKIFLAKLPQGQIGKENAFLLGSLLVSKFQQLAMSRQRMAQERRRDFWIYVDEFHHFITPSMAEILTGARKYRIGLILAHQELRQLQRDSEVASAVMSNPYTRVVFRVGDTDARALESGFSNFGMRDLQNLGTGEAICRVERSDFDFNLTVDQPPPADPAREAEIRKEVVTASRKKYATPRAEIEEAMRKRHEAPDRGAELKSEPPEEKPPVSTPPPPTEPAEPKTKASSPPQDMGRGGAQHRAIQQRLKTEAEQLGFRATIEKEVLGGAGSIDLVLERESQSFAYEIAITSTIDHEVGNVAKCLKAGFTNVAVIATSEDRLGKLKSAINNSLGADSRVSYFLPDQCIAWLQSITLREAQPAATEKRRRGYKVTRTVAQLSPEETKAREAEAIRLVAESMKRRTQ